MIEKTQKQKMLAGELYVANDPELTADNRRISEWLDRYNATNTMAQPERQALLEEALGAVGSGCN
ncbi:MAG TPA: maltose acetyltransferase domain-containing protein, partial [Paralcaligenes sp.]